MTECSSIFTPIHAQVSTVDQDLRLQRQKLKDAESQKLLEERRTGSWRPPKLRADQRTSARRGGQIGQ